LRATDKSLIQILVLETDSTFSSRILDILQTKAGLSLFNINVTSNLREAFKKIQEDQPEIILMDMDPQEDPEFVQLTRLHQYEPHTPIVILLEDHHQSYALQGTQKGAHQYLLKSQLNEGTLPSFLLRTIESNATQKAIRESEERFRLMIENASDVITTLESTGTITYAGPSTERILNYPLSEFIGRNALDYIHRDDRRSFLDHLERAFENNHQLSNVQFRFRHQQGHWLHMEAKGRIVEETSGKRICILNTHDISHRVKLEEKLRVLSLRDELTGLHNRRSFITFFEQQLKVTHRAKKKGVYLLFIDLDKFKWINDTLGHKVGDQALVDAARIFKETFRQADLIARLGGDEFVILLTDDFEEVHADSLKRRLFEYLEAWNQKEERPYRLSMSVGIVYRPPQPKRIRGRVTEQS